MKLLIYGMCLFFFGTSAGAVEEMELWRESCQQVSRQFEEEQTCVEHHDIHERTGAVTPYWVKCIEGEPVRKKFNKNETCVEQKVVF